MMKSTALALVSCALFVTGAAGTALAQRAGYPPSEFAARRQTLMAQAPDGLIILFGEVSRPAASRFLQDNDFYYFTGSEDLGAILVMVPRTKDAFLFLPQQAPREEIMEGANLLKDPKGAQKAGVTAIHPVGYFDEYLARTIQSAGATFRLRLAPRDTIDGARSESGIFYGRRARIHYNDQIPLDQYRIAKLRERYPTVAFADITPLIDKMRAIKSPAEIAVLRRNGVVSAEAVRQAMLATRPGAYEYEGEAAAMHVVLKNGGLGAAYAPIVGSGPNTIVQHYSDNSRRIEAGDLVLMDFGGNLDHMAMDITRTWPASGTFTPEQRQVYERVLAVEKACIEAYRPGATADDVRKHVAEVMKQTGLEQGAELRGGFGHGVGLATHDVPLGTVLREGMVFAIEPALYFPDKNIGIRIEDTVLITKDGCEVLTRDVPKEIDEIEALLGRRPKT
jgi:Xaa-Pro aminopeptidase